MDFFIKILQFFAIFAVTGWFLTWIYTKYINSKLLALSAKEKSANNEIPHEHIELSVKGLMPIQEGGYYAFEIKIFDITDTNNHHIVSSFDMYSKGRFHPHIVPIGHAEYGEEFNSWTWVMSIIKSTLVPPYRGKRTLMIDVSLIGKDFKSTVGRHIFHHSFDEEGYLEDLDKIEEAQVLIIQLSTAVAFSYNNFSDNKYAAIKEWVEGIISPYAGSIRGEYRKYYNRILRDAVMSKNEDIESAVRKLSKMPKFLKSQALSLCLSMSEVPNDTNLTLIQDYSVFSKVGEKLGFSGPDLHKIKEHRMRYLTR